MKVVEGVPRRGEDGDGPIVGLYVPLMEARGRSMEAFVGHPGLISGPTKLFLVEGKLQNSEEGNTRQREETNGIQAMRLSAPCSGKAERSERWQMSSHRNRGELNLEVARR